MGRKCITLLTAAFLAVAGTALAGAGDRTGRYEISPYIGGYVFDSMGYENNVVLGAHGGRWFNDAFSAELSLDFVPTHTHTGTEQAWLGQLHADALYHFRLGDTWAPYLVAGVGLSVNESDNEELDEGWDLLFNYGAGVKYFIDETWAARLDLRQPILHEEESTHHNFMYTVGVSYFFGGPAAPAAAKAEPPPPPPPPQVTAQLTANPASIERGSSTALQWSTTGSSQTTIEGVGAVPTTGTITVAPLSTTTYTLKAQGPGGSAQANVKVAVREPPPPPAPAPVDSDRDGVTDDKDKCPNTPAGIAVDAQGCPLDSDRDGLTDADETGRHKTDPKNPDTDADGLTDGDEVLKYRTDPLKADTDGDGLKDGDEALRFKTDPLKADTDSGGVPDGIEVNVAKTDPLSAKDDVKKVKSIDLQILFDSDSDVVKPEYLPKVEEVAKFMKEYPQVTGTIEGHTDNMGDDAYNLDLSKRRAESVMKLLVDRYGIEAGQLRAEGYGEAKPVASNDTADGRQKNRRILAVFEAK